MERLSPPLRMSSATAAALVAVVLLAAPPFMSKARATGSGPPIPWTLEEQLSFRPRTLEEAAQQLKQIVARRRVAHPLRALPGSLDDSPQGEAISNLARFGVWSELAPPRRDYHELFYDAPRDRFLIAGGAYTGQIHDVWELRRNGSEWRRIPAPPGGSGAITLLTAHDVLNDRLLGYGVSHVNWVAKASLWEFPLSGNTGWRQIIGLDGGLPIADVIAADAATGDLYFIDRNQLTVRHANGQQTEYPALGVNSARDLIVDPDRRVLYAIQDYTELVAIDLRTWSARSLGYLNIARSGQDHFRLALDSATGDVYVAGGRGSLSRWSEEVGVIETIDASESIARRDAFALAFDPRTRSLVMHGGWNWSRWQTWSETRTRAIALPSSWERLGPWSGDARMWHRAVYDSRRNRMIVIGGRTSFDISDSLITRSLARDEEGAQPLEVAPGPSPGKRYGHGIVYDSKRDQVVLFGGQATDGTGRYLDDVLALSLSEPVRWTEVYPSGVGPGPRVHHDFFYDAENDRFLLYGGETAAGQIDGVWELKLEPAPAWRLLPISPGDQWPRRGGMFWDQKTSSIWAVHRTDSLHQIRVDADRATRIAHGIDVPFDYHIMPRLFDPKRRRIIVFPAFYPSDSRAEFSVYKSLELEPTPHWREYKTHGAIPYHRLLESVIYDEQADRMVIHGGYDDSDHYFDDTYALAFRPEGLVHETPRGGLVPVTAVARTEAPVERAALQLALVSRAPGNIVRVRVAVELSASMATEASIELLDVTGRRIAQRRTTLTAGRTERIELSNGSALHAGVYFVRARISSETRTLRAVVLE